MNLKRNLLFETVLLIRETWKIKRELEEDWKIVSPRGQTNRHLCVRVCVYLVRSAHRHWWNHMDGHIRTSKLTHTHTRTHTRTHTHKHTQTHTHT